MGRDIQTLCQDVSVIACLIEHIDEIRVFQDIRNLRTSQHILYVLGDAGRNTAPLTKSLPNLHGIGSGLFFLQKQMELVHIVAGSFTGVSVGSNTAPDLILNDQHTDFFQLLAQLLDVIADQTIVNVHVGTMVEQIQRTLDVDFKGSCHMAGFLFFLFQQGIVQIFENSDFVYMLNQAAGDRQILAQQLNISPHQLSYVTHSGEGQGLLFYGNVILPFVDRFPTDLELYKIMTTKLSEVQEAKEG